MNCKTNILSLIFFVSFSFSSVAAYEPMLTEDQDIADVMSEHGAQGTVVIASLDNETMYVHNAERAKEYLSPASTFKIVNSIIALETRVIKDQYETIEWDGEKHFLDTCNKDQNLKSAFRVSCVWFYQKLAMRIGREQYLQCLKMLAYGNGLVGDGEQLTTFWLSGGDLKITPLEQIDFLQRIYKRQLPISGRTYDILQDIMLEEESGNYKLYSKTAAATQDWKGHGWYVGYVEVKDRVWFFATNILISSMEDLPKRKAITVEVLKRKGLIR